MLIIADNRLELAPLHTEAIKNFQIDKVTVWDKVQRRMESPCAGKNSKPDDITGPAIKVVPIKESPRNSRKSRFAGNFNSGIY